jgi:hypothetical protein
MRDEEEKQLSVVARQIAIACGTRFASDARTSVADLAIARINSTMKRLSKGISNASTQLESSSIEGTTARLDQELALAEASLKAKQFDYDTALMYRSYPTVNVDKAKAEVSAARDNLARVRAAREKSARAPASASMSSSLDATERMAALVELSNRYQKLRSNAEYCRWTASGSPGTLYDPEAKAPSAGAGFAGGP